MNELLIKDMKDFKILQKNKEPNRSRFVCLLVENFIDGYMKSIEEKIDAAASRLIEELEINKSKAYAVASKIMFASSGSISFDDDKKTKRKKVQWRVRVSKAAALKTEEVIDSIPADVDYSAFFRNMFSIYLSLPRYRREWLLHKATYEKLNSAKGNYGVRFKYRDYLLDGVIYPLEIAHDTKQEMFNYVIANTENGIRSYHLSDISDVENRKRDNVIIPENFNEIYNLMKKNGIQFGITVPEYYYVELSKKDYRAYKSRYFDRPEYVKKEYLDDGRVRLYFDCSRFQLETAYLKPFNDEIKLVEYDPKTLLEK